MSVQTAERVHSQIVSEASQRAAPGVRVISSIKVGQVVRQGDIYIHRVGSNHSRGAVARSRQLAVGTTQGSRHVAELPAIVYEGSERPKWCTGQLLGPLFVVPAGQRCVVSHPEHAHVDLPAGTYQVTHQMDARTLDRVRD